MAQPDDLQAKMQRAVELIGEAEFYEKAGDLERSVPLYEEAAHLLSQAGFPGDKVGELYDRIKLLKQAMQQLVLQQAVAKEQANANAEDEAFSLIDQAESALKSGDFDNALAMYQQALPKLAQAGYSTQHVEDKIKELSNRVQQPPSVMKPVASPATAKPAKIIKPVGATKPIKPAGIQKPEITVHLEPPSPAQAAPASVAEPQPVMAPLAAQVKDVPVEVEKKFEDFKEFRGKVEEMESKAFELIDKAKALTEEEKYTDALATYGIIMNLLRNAGWKEDQLEPILIQQNLVKDIMDTQVTRKVPAAPVMVVDSAPSDVTAEADIPRIVKQKLDLFLDQDTKMRQAKESQLKRQNVEAEAFNLLNEAQKLYKFVEIKDYPGAIELYQRSIQLLTRAGWTDQISYLQLEVEKLKDLYEQQARMEQARAVEEHRAAEELKMQANMETEKKAAVENNLASISTMLGRIDAQKKKEQELAEQESIKQKLLEEKRYKQLVSRPAGEKSFDSIKEMLFGDKDSKVAAQKEAEKKQHEQDFLSNVSKKFYSFKKAEKEAETPAMQSVEKVVDFVHQETIATQHKERIRVDIVDPKKKQEQEVKKAQQEKDQAVGDVLSMLGAMKQKKTEKKPEDEKESGIKDDELKKMFADLKKKQ